MRPLTPVELIFVHTGSCLAENWEQLFPAESGFHSRTMPVSELADASPAPDLLVVSLERDNAGGELASLPAVPAIALLPSDSTPELLRAAAAAADDFLLLPLRSGELLGRIERILRVRHGDPEIAAKLGEDLAMMQLVGRDPVFLRAVSAIPKLARAGLPVLISGETGTGKELCARAIHHLSARRDRPFIAVGCGAVPDSLFESEFFGHARGAFTGAHADQKGLVELAQGGTLFLDEVDSLSASAQSKLLRFLEDKTFRPLGSARFSHADLRILAGSNKSLAERAAKSEFRSDLLFRLDVLRIELPPLRERRGDLRLLAEHLLFLHAPEGGAREISPSAIRRLAHHGWPGNVRELQNVLLRASINAAGSVIMPGDLGLGAPDEAESPDCDTFNEARRRALAEFERDYVYRLIRRHNGNVTRAAREAGKERRAFGRLVKKYGVGM